MILGVRRGERLPTSWPLAERPTVFERWTFGVERGRLLRATSGYSGRQASASRGFPEGKVFLQKRPGSLPDAFPIEKKFVTDWNKLGLALPF